MYLLQPLMQLLIPQVYLVTIVFLFQPGRLLKLVPLHLEERRGHAALAEVAGLHLDGLPVPGGRLVASRKPLLRRKLAHAVGLLHEGLRGAWGDDRLLHGTGAVGAARPVGGGDLLGDGVVGQWLGVVR